MRASVSVESWRMLFSCRYGMRFLPNNFIIVALNRSVVMAVENWLLISDELLEQLSIKTITVYFGLAEMKFIPANYRACY